MKAGTQIVYMPSIAKGNLKHKEVEYGFVLEPKGEYFHWCHFWNKNSPGKLRTRKRPDMVPNDNLVEKKSVPQKQVDEMMEKLKIPR
jgi:hypothetical protein